MATEDRLSVLRRELAEKTAALEAAIAAEIARIDEELASRAQAQESAPHPRRPKPALVTLHKPRKAGLSGLTPTQAIRKLVEEDPKHEWGIREFRDKLFDAGLETSITTEKALYMSVATIMKRLASTGYLKVLNTPKGQRFIKNEEISSEE